MKHQGPAGFTLVELMVSVAIFAAITTMAVWNHARFNGTVLLTNLAYEIALSIRQAQVYGITVREGSSGAFDSGYGIHFDPANPASYLLFEDRAPRNRIYDAGEELETFSISKGNGIRKVCADGACGSSVLDISFIRPNPDAYIKSVGSGSPSGTATICVSSPQNERRRVIVESTGQISVQTDDGTCQ
jgi:prepilin-type N-terminal cleavage/methylation domain-containing protein